jgi:hypothetical protein
MGLFTRTWLFLSALLLSGLGALAEEPSLNLDWSLSNEREFFQEVRSPSRAVPRHFKLNVRKANKEGAEACIEEAKEGKPQRAFCQALARRLAPVFSFAFDALKPGTFILDRIDVECFKISSHRGQGFVKDNAYYQLLLPARPGVVQREPVQKLVFNSTGTAELQVWPDLQAGEPVGSLELEIRFHFHSGSTHAEVRTGHFILSL